MHDALPSHDGAVPAWLPVHAAGPSPREKADSISLGIQTFWEPPMLLSAQIAIAVVLLIHVYIVLLETVMFDTRGRRVFGLSAEKAAIVKPAMSNQGCYNGFLVAALAVALLHGDPAVRSAFATF